MTALLLAGALAAVPAGAALAGGSDGADGNSSGAGAVPAQSTAPEGGQDRGGDRGDCPEKGGQQESQESVQL